MQIYQKLCKCRIFVLRILNVLRFNDENDDNALCVNMFYILEEWKKTSTREKELRDLYYEFSEANYVDLIWERQNFYFCFSIFIREKKRLKKIYIYIFVKL